MAGRGWSFIEPGKPEGFPQKSEETPSQGGLGFCPEKSQGKNGGGRGGSNKQLVAKRAGNWRGYAFDCVAGGLVLWRRMYGVVNATQRL